MPRKSKNGIQPIGVGLTAKQMKRRKPINADMLRDIEPLTENQKKLFESYDEGKNLIALMVLQERERPLYHSIKHYVMSLIQTHLMRRYTLSDRSWPPER